MCFNKSLNANLLQVATVAWFNIDKWQAVSGPCITARDSNPETIFNPGISVLSFLNPVINPRFTISSWFMLSSIFQGLKQMPIDLLMCTLLLVLLSTVDGLSKAIVFACIWYDVMMLSADYLMKCWMLIDKQLLQVQQIAINAIYY